MYRFNCYELIEVKRNIYIYIFNNDENGLDFIIAEWSDRVLRV